MPTGNNDRARAIIPNKSAGWGYKNSIGKRSGRVSIA
jgi:hypothetical protein